MRASVVAVILVILVLSLGLNGYLALQSYSLSQSNSSLTSELQVLERQGTFVINGTVFDVAALRLNNAAGLAGGTVLLFRNMMFSYVPNTSNGTRWMEFMVMPVSNSGMPQDLKAFWWPTVSFTRGYNEAFTSGWNPIAGVMMKPGDTAYVYLLVSITPILPT
jgi:hypothetical protein